MGLDQYLYVRKGVDSKHTQRVAGENVWVENPAFDEIVNKVGVRHYLDSKDSGYKWLSVLVPVAYWRKTYHIHDWFVRNVQDGDDDCGTYNVHSDTLTELRDTLATVMALPVEERRAKQEELLPIEDWHDSDEWWKSINETNEWTLARLTELLDLAKADGHNIHFVYKSSW
jgi:hypothetical protein